MTSVRVKTALSLTSGLFLPVLTQTVCAFKETVGEFAREEAAVFLQFKPQLQVSHFKFKKNAINVGSDEVTKQKWTE